MPSTVPNRTPAFTLNGDYLHVVVAVIANSAGEIVIARRHEQLHQGGFWEFPGGKVESGEMVLEALKREIKEELGICVEQARPLIRVPHNYPDRNVLLDVWRVTAFSGEVCGAEGQPIKWVKPERLPVYDFPAANGPIVSAAILPDEYLITPEPGEQSNWPLFLSQLNTSLEDGISLVQFRAPGLEQRDYLALADKVRACCQQYGTTLLLNTMPSALDVCAADGIHLTSRRLMAMSERAIPSNKWLAASCHNLDELRQAEKIGVDFVLLSPVKPTQSHPGEVGMGWQDFHALTDQCTLPVYALGGMGKEDLPEAWQHGAQGIAAIRALWG